jgi:group I intron endonuclease
LQLNKIDKYNCAMCNGPGIYSITNTKNGKRYIGSSVRVNVRYGTHVYYLRRGRHHSQILQRAWVKYGEAAFKLEVLEECAPDKQTLLERENYWLSIHKPEYNISVQARSNLGAKFSDSTKAKMRASHVSRGEGAEAWRQSISVATKGPRASQGPMSAERRMKISQAKKGCVSPAKGRKMSEEHKAKIADAQRGSKRPWSDTTKARGWLRNLSEDEKKAFFARRAASLRATLQKKRAARIEGLGPNRAAGRTASSE